MNVIFAASPVIYFGKGGTSGTVTYTSFHCWGPSGLHSFLVLLATFDVHRIDLDGITCMNSTAPPANHLVRGGLSFALYLRSSAWRVIPPCSRMHICMDDRTWYLLGFGSQTYSTRAPLPRVAAWRTIGSSQLALTSVQ